METTTTLEFQRSLADVLTFAGLVVAVLIVLFGARYAMLSKRWRAVGFRPRTGTIFSLRAAALLIAALVIGVGVAEPAIVISEEVRERTDVEVCFLIDNAGSVAASETPDTKTRIEREIDIAIQLLESDAFSGVPVCVGTFGNGATLHLPMTAHRPTVRVVLEDGITIGDPAQLPERGCYPGRTCTTLSALQNVTNRNFFTPGKQAERILFVFTDGETRGFSEQGVISALETAGVSVVFIDVWSFSEQIFNQSGCVEVADGCIDPEYASDTLGRQIFLDFVELSDSLSFTEEETEALMLTAAEMLGDAPESPSGRVIESSQEREPIGWIFIFIGGLVVLVVHDDYLVKGRRQK